MSGRRHHYIFALPLTLPNAEVCPSLFGISLSILSTSCHEMYSPTISALRFLYWHLRSLEVSYYEPWWDDDKFI